MPSLVSSRLAAKRIGVRENAINMTAQARNYSERVGHIGSNCCCLLHIY